MVHGKYGIELPVLEGKLEGLAPIQSLNLVGVPELGAVELDFIVEGVETDNFFQGRGSVLLHSAHEVARAGADDENASEEHPPLRFEDRLWGGVHVVHNGHIRAGPALSATCNQSFLRVLGLLFGEDDNGLGGGEGAGAGSLLALLRARGESAVVCHENVPPERRGHEAVCMQSLLPPPLGIESLGRGVGKSHPGLVEVGHAHHEEDAHLRDPLNLRNH
mmetsp:Transcript_46139/g.147633  ORF Transcript_46139/g.147633 Transcript_46139/m.147633 type:complete len:219 (-) Transcript_46139:498-1154(-)